MLSCGCEDPDSLRARDVDIAALIAFHAVHDATRQVAIANLLREDAAITERTIGCDVEHADMGARRIVHVEKFFIGREAYTVRLSEIIRFQMQISIGRDPE